MDVPTDPAPPSPAEAQRRLADTLMSRAAGGDRDAFGQLAEVVGPAIYRFCLAQLPRRMHETAADVRQECFLRAWRSRRKYRPGLRRAQSSRGSAVAWLFGIAMNVVRERRRKYQPAASLGDFDPAERARADPDERLARLASAVQALPNRQREAIACRFGQGMSVAETAAAMGCAEGTVKAAVFKAIANLRRMMSQEQP